MDFEKAVRLVLEKLNTWLTELVRMLPNLILASVVLIVGFYIAKTVRKFARKRLRIIFPHNVLVSLLVNVIYVFLLGIVIFTGLKILNLDKDLTSLLAGAGIVGLALAFAFQDIAANFMSGIFISVRKPFDVGDIIKTKDFMGHVRSIRLRDTTVETFQGQLVTLPNKDVFQNPIVNYTRQGRLDIKGGVSYSDDLEKAARVALDALKGAPNIMADKCTFHYDGWGDSAVEFTILVWADDGEQKIFWEVQHEVIKRVTEAFDANAISIPFPIRTLDFSMGGNPNQVK